MDKGGPPLHSHLFTLRLWAEEMGDDQTEWRGEVRHVTSGETRYFREWSTLVTLLLAMLPGAGDKQPQE
jgi:hypothetical protein